MLLKSGQRRAWMDRDAREQALCSTRELDGEGDIGQFGTGVRFHRRVTLVPIQILPVQLATPGDDGAHRDDSSGSRANQRRQQQSSQRKVAKMVGSEGQFEAV